MLKNSQFSFIFLNGKIHWLVSSGLTPVSTPCIRNGKTTPQPQIRTPAVLPALITRVVSRCMSTTLADSSRQHRKSANPGSGSREAASRNRAQVRGRIRRRI
uniref:Uncharacterized protein n=1 Tax=Cacopsylla melanoneura TaxID=428564 RepID=A0A8D9E4S9_9HEMI